MNRCVSLALIAVAYGCATEVREEAQLTLEEVVEVQGEELVAFPPPVTMMRNAFPINGISGATWSQRFYSLQVPATKTSVEFNTWGGTGDADLIVRRGARPTLNVSDCHQRINGNSQTCSFGLDGSSQAGTWYVMIFGWRTYSGLSLNGFYSPLP